MLLNIGTVPLEAKKERTKHMSNLSQAIKAEIIIGKQLNGPIGTANVAFIKDYARFDNLSEIVIEDTQGF